MRRPEKAIYRFLDTSGDGTGTKNANGNYSGAVSTFYFQPVANCEIHRIMWMVSDTKGMEPEEYGNLGAALTNGFSIEVQNSSDESTIIDITDGVPIKKNGDWSRIAYDAQLLGWGNTANEVAAARLTFARAGQPLLLKQSMRLAIPLNDDLSGLIEHYFMIQGYYV